MAKFVFKRYVIYYLEDPSKGMVDGNVYCKKFETLEQAFIFFNMMAGQNTPIMFADYDAL